MKSILRHYVIDTVSLYLISQVASGIVFEKGFESLALAGIGLMIATLLIKPIVNILILPLNLITFGLFKWVGSAIALYLVTLVVPGFKIVSFGFGGTTTSFFEIPALSFEGILSLIAFSFLLSFVTSFINWLIK